MFTWSPETGKTFIEYTGPVQPGPLPPPPKYVRVVNQVFERLKWSVLDPPSQVEIFSLDSDDKPQWTLLSTDPIADEAVTIPPRFRLKISLDPLVTWEHWQQSQQEPPELLLIENADGQPISVKQFIQAVHDYTVPLRMLLCKSCDLYGRQEQAQARFYFMYIDPGCEAGTLDDTGSHFLVGVAEDTDQVGHGLALRLEMVEILYRRQLAAE